MDTKKEKIENLLQAANNLKNVIYWLDKAGDKMGVAQMYEVLENITGEVSLLSSEIKNNMFK